MIETKDITKMVNNVIRRGQGASDPQIMHPSREWFVGLSISFVIVMLGTWFSVYTYQSFQEKMMIEITASVETVPYQATFIDQAVLLYKARYDVYKSDITATHTTVEPEEEVSTPTVAPAVEVTATPEVTENSSVQMSL